MAEYGDGIDAFDAVMQQLANQGLATSRLPPLAALYRRLTYAFPGDPVLPIAAASTGPANTVGLPASDPAVTASLQVAGGTILWTVDGSIPTAANAQSAVTGSLITITGQASLRAFQFCGAAGAASLIGSFYD